MSTGSTVQNVSYTYDALNRLATVSESGQPQAAYTYDTNGNRASLTYANGVTETYRYNKANWLTDVENKNAGGVVSSFTYTYYASGSQKSKTDQTGNVTSYTYDGLNRLTQESETGGLTHSYSYDANGNRAQMTVSGTANYVTTYCYDAANRLLSENCTGDGSSEMRCTYDADGNLLTRTVTSADGIAGATYQYDLFGQLVLSNEGGIQAAYAYNAQGIRTEKTTSAGWTQYLLDGGNVIGEQTDAELITYLRGVNLISRTAAGNTEYYLFNAHGDVTELTSNRAVVTKTYHYDAFGVETSPDPLDKNPFRYCGEYFDTETGTYYLRARYYDPNIGRFTQQDTHWNTANSIYGDNPQKINEREDKLGLKTYSYAPQITAVMQSGNLYVYGVSNPVAYVDRDGKIATELAIAASAFLYSVASILAFKYIQNATVAAWNAIWNAISALEICSPYEGNRQLASYDTTIQIKSINWNADKEHILKGSKIHGGHDWGKFGIDPKGDPSDNWKLLLPILQKVVSEYDKTWSETRHNGATLIFYLKYFVNEGVSVAVRFWLDVDGTLKLSDAYIWR
ncbi:MAG: RHS repeat-associated core domain-containing protein [Oscillospiraceae bacterium]